MLGSEDERLRHRFIETFLDQYPEKSKLILLAQERSTPLWYRAFSTRHDDKYVCAEGGHDDKELVDRFLGETINKQVEQGDLSSFPALFIHCGRTNLSHPVREWLNYDLSSGDRAHNERTIAGHCSP